VSVGDALDELCAQRTRDLFAIAKFLLFFGVQNKHFCTVVYTYAASMLQPAKLLLVFTERNVVCKFVTFGY